MRKLIIFLKKFIRINKIFTPARILILGLLIIILIGAALLSLPVSARGGEGMPFLSALFTSVSAVCVTGLTVADTFTAWSVFGQIVILVLVQVGALGIMTVMTIFFFAMRKEIGISQRLLIMTSLNLQDLKGVVRLIRHVVIGTFVIEGIGAVVLWIRFSFDFGIWRGLGMGLFHSVMAFCNAGFDLMGKNSPFSSLTLYSGDAVVSITVSLLVIIGGIGFFVWEDILQKRSLKKLHLHSKLVLSISAFLILAGWVFFYISEKNNPATLGGMSLPDAALASLFQSVTPRSGGFSTINQSLLTDISKLFTMLLMFVGGSVGSTSGGIKNVTAGVLVLSAVNSLRGKSRVSAFGRTIPNSQILVALSIAMTAAAACFISSAAICLIQDIPYMDVLFETVSAMGTVGLSTGITPMLAPLSQVIIMLLMFFGRAGIMTIGMAAVMNRNEIDKIKYPESMIMIG